MSGVRLWLSAPADCLQKPKELGFGAFTSWAMGVLKPTAARNSGLDRLIAFGLSVFARVLELLVRITLLRWRSKQIPKRVAVAA
jgi:hypothetical protein